MSEGWHGWDDYAPFYDWENAQNGQQTGRRVLAGLRGGSRDGARARLRHRPAALPLLKSARDLVGIDRSEPMLSARASKARRARTRASRPLRARRHPPPAVSRAPGSGWCMAPYGMLQSLTRERGPRGDARGVARVHGARRRVRDRPGARSAAVVRIRAARDAVGLVGRAHASHAAWKRCARIARRRLTMFDQEYVERRGTGAPRAPFRADVPHAVDAADAPAPREGRLSASTRCWATTRAGPGTPGADVWVILAAKRLKVVGSIRVIFFRLFGGFSPCPAIPSGTRSSTRRARLTPSAARFSRASSRN